MTPQSMKKHKELYEKSYKNFFYCFQDYYVAVQLDNLEKAIISLRGV